MKKCFLIILSLVGVLFAQEQKASFAKHSLGFNYGTNLSYRTLKQNKDYTDDDFIGHFISNRKSKEKPAYGFSLGLDYAFQFHKNIALNAGVNYVGNTYNIRLFGITDLNNSSIGTGTLSYSLRTLEFPVEINYYFLNMQKFRLMASAGINNAWIINNINKLKNFELESGYEDFELQKRYKNHFDYYTYLLGLTAGIGIDYFPIDKLMLRFEPNMRYFFYSNTDSPIREYPYSFGLNIGAYWRFGM